MTSCRRSWIDSVGRRCRASCWTSACPRCRSTIPAAVSRTRRTLRWTCGWAVRNSPRPTILNTYSRAELASILRRYGEERFADRIARRIVAERDREPFTTSGRLVQLLYDTIPMATRKTGGHPAKRTFQALRIEVNDELAALESVLPSAVAALAVGGRIAVLAYHSLEDRLVKQILAIGSHDRAPRDLPVVPPGMGPELRLLTRGAQRPTAAEVAVNPRAASARLRAAVRIDEPHKHRDALEVSA